MAKPRIFLSSTCYDLTDARAALTKFLEEWGFEVLNSQNKKFGVKPKAHSHDACLAMMQNADYVVLIIGGRRGGTYVGSEKSITNEEIRAAQKLERPIFAFLDKQVHALRQTYRKNPKANFESAVDDVRIFDFIDYVASGHDDNWLHLFDDVTDIKDILRTQFAYILLLYSQSLRKKDARPSQQREQTVGFPSALDGAPGDDEAEQTLFRAGLRQVYNSLKALLDADVKDSAKQEQLKSIWVIARHGRADDSCITLREDRFKASAWGKHKGERVFAQLTGCGIAGRYDFEEDEGRPYQTVELVFQDRRDTSYPAEALHTWVRTLVERYGDDEGLEMFKRLDMRIFSDAKDSSAKPRAKVKVASARAPTESK
ncbi:DUF4062 domain-containing protein [Bradyrhizobium sp. 146]|uniref:DUF4062 domain-containing protein n=1 Tax=Bradyrhizobium sp. 146 TaxID=2782622 RepID=UPI001FFB09E2|nr:DUF4062 domain-containing protein [Bradyrhizobium sp. 146]MCK1702607.1 DUF4062 domain-containing protein [Bradyrhizobium sp. 146]